jgi:hypothetical protein
MAGDRDPCNASSKGTFPDPERESAPPEYRVGFRALSHSLPRAFPALLDFEAHALTLSKGPETVVLNRAEVNEDVIAFAGLDETETLALIDPFDFTF